MAKLGSFTSLPASPAITAATIIDKVAVVSGNPFVGNYLYTIGNTDYDHPELLLFYHPYKLTHYSELLRQFSYYIHRFDLPPVPHRRMTVLGQHFYPVLVDRPFIGVYAEPARRHYGYARDLTMMQLLLPDPSGHYPFDPHYNQHEFNQRLLKLH